MKKVITALLAISLIVGAFATGVYASNNGWLSFTGDTKIERSKTDVDEIMSILRQVNEDKLTAEEALAEFEALNPPGLVKQIKALKEEVAALESEKAALETELVAVSEMIAHQAEYISHLEAELTRANEEVNGLSGKTSDALEEAREIEGGR